MIDSMDFVDEEILELVTSHSVAKTRLERAKIQRTVKEALRKRASSHPDYDHNVLRTLLKDVLGNTFSENEVNSYLLNNYSQYAWKLIDEDKVFPRTVINIVKEAKEAAETYGISLDKAVELINNSYGWHGKKYIKIENQTVEVKNNEKVVSYTDWDEFYEKAQSLLGDGVEVDDAFKKFLLRNFKIELKNLVSQYKKRMEVKLEFDTECKFITPSELKIACDTLGISKPESGTIVDHRVLKKKYKSLALAYHPDRNSGNDNVIFLFHKVNEAYSTILRYNEGIERNTYA